MWNVLRSSTHPNQNMRHFTQIFKSFKDIGYCVNAPARNFNIWTSPAKCRSGNLILGDLKQCDGLLRSNTSSVVLKQGSLLNGRGGGSSSVAVRGFVPGGYQQQRCFRTSSKRDALPAFVVMVLGRVAKLGAMLVGRTVRRWWKTLPPEERAVYSGKVRRNRYIIAGILGALGFGSFVYYEKHVQVTPFTMRKRFLAFTPQQIYEMARLELETLLLMNEKKIISTQGGAPAYVRIAKVAQQLLNANQNLPQIHDMEWTITVVDNENEINAFVLPCGSIFVYTGLLKLCDSDDQLGIILGHEMAHAVMGHGAEKASYMHFMDLMFIIPLAALWALLPTDITAAIAHWITAKLTDLLMELPHSRFIEEEADVVGLALAAAACFDIREAPVVWAKMRIMDGGDMSSSIEWLSTHPSHEKRQAQLESMLPEAMQVREKCQCPLLPAFDPRLKIGAYERNLKSNAQQRREKLIMPLKVESRTL